MAYLWLKCDECEEEVEVYCDGDNAMMCPECRSIDCFSHIDDEANPCNEIAESIENFDIINRNKNSVL